MTKGGHLITDEETRVALRARADVDLIIDRFDRHPATQKPQGKDGRDRAAVEAALKARGVTLNLD